jgi:excisionase family DNA binding protein
MTAVDPQELLTPDQVCALLKMKRTWFYAQVARGVIRPIKLGRSTRVRRRDLEAYLSALEDQGTTPAPSARPAASVLAQGAPAVVGAPEEPTPAAGQRSRLRSVQRPAQPPATTVGRDQQLTLTDQVG